MDSDVRAFCFALGYNAVILVFAFISWNWGIRRVRGDKFDIRESLHEATAMPISFTGGPAESSRPSGLVEELTGESKSHSWIR
jgi:hypothetical protein